jgi:AraC-like DNA-binding protein
MDYRIAKVIALMKEHLHRGWPPGKLARFVNISPSRLHQLFKDETGTPPFRYLHLLRMERARELLETSYLSVKEVMVRVGVSDESHFVRAFKKSYGLTPARYRERFRNGHGGNGSAMPALLSALAPALAARPDVKLSSSASLSSTTKATPPLLLRRASHPRHLAEDRSPLTQSKKKRDILSLMYLRHQAFAELTTAITDSLARGSANARSIQYRPRLNCFSRQLPVGPERRRVRQPSPPSTVPPRIYTSNSRHKG